MKFSFIRKRILISCSGFSQIKCTFASIVSIYKFVLSSIFLILIWTMPHLAKCARPPTPTPPLKHNVSLEISASLTFLAQLYQLIETTQNRINIGKSLVTHRTVVDRRALDLIVYANSMIIHLNRTS